MVGARFFGEDHYLIDLLIDLPQGTRFSLTFKERMPEVVQQLWDELDYGKFGMALEGGQSLGHYPVKKNFVFVKVHEEGTFGHAYVLAKVFRHLESLSLFLPDRKYEYQYSMDFGRGYVFARYVLRKQED